MWNYEKRLQYPINITQPNPKIAMIIMSQYGGPDGEAAASMRYLSQRYATPYREIAGLLTDIGTSVSNTIIKVKCEIASNYFVHPHCLHRIQLDIMAINSLLVGFPLLALTVWPNSLSCASMEPRDQATSMAWRKALSTLLAVDPCSFAT